MTRWKAAAIHMAIGLVLIGGVIGLMFALWFPYGLYRIAAMDRLIFTMAGVDIVAGPLLTLIVYKAGKSSLRFDLSVIAVLQACFLGYALHTAWITRPVFLVWGIDSMSLVFANDIQPNHLAAGTTPGSNSLSHFGPRLMAVTVPKDLDARQRKFTEIIRSQTTVERLPRFFEPYDSARAYILRRSQPVTEATMAADPALRDAVAATGRAARDFHVAHIESARDASTVLLDATTARPVDVLPPFAARKKP